VIVCTSHIENLAEKLHGGINYGYTGYMAYMVMSVFYDALNNSRWLVIPQMVNNTHINCENWWAYRLYHSVPGQQFTERTKTEKNNKDVKMPHPPNLMKEREFSWNKSEHVNIQKKQDATEKRDNYRLSAKCATNIPLQAIAHNSKP